MFLPLLLIILLNPLLTPGVVRPLTVEQICSTTWGTDRRLVTEKMKQQVITSYGLKREAVKARGKGPCCEIDHQIPRSLGGADDVRNLRPQPWDEADRKDQQEARLHRLVCSGQLPLATAQEFMRLWP